MAEIMFTFTLFFLAMIFAAVLFTGWAVYSIFRVIFWIIAGVFRSFASRQAPRNARPANPTIAQTQICSNSRCLQNNPASARYCRRCGQALFDNERSASARTAVA